MKDENSSDKKERTRDRIYLICVILIAFSPFLVEWYAVNHDNIITKSLMGIFAVFFILTMGFVIGQCVMVMGLLLGEVSRKITIRNALTGIGVYYTIVFVIKTLEKIGRGYVRYMPYKIIGFPFFVVAIMYIYKWVLEKVEEYRKKKIKVDRHKESPTEK